MIALQTGGLLLLQDKTFPNVVTIVTGESLRRSWWGHPLGHKIFRTLTELAANPDVVVCKLLDGKVTFVHRRLWPALLAVASADEPWQTAGLSVGGHALWDQVKFWDTVESPAPTSTELERRLLVHGDQVHTASGNHRTRLETWQTWAERSDCQPKGTAAQGRSVLEAAVRALGGSIESLPWHRFLSNQGPRP